MSKKSRTTPKKEELLEASAEAVLSGEETTVAEHAAPIAPEREGDEGEALLPEEPLHEGTGETVAAEGGEQSEDILSLPESVAEGTLCGEVPAGEGLRLSLILEAILFASQKAVSVKEFVSHLRNAATAAAANPSSQAHVFARLKEGAIHEALVELQAEVAASGRAYQVRETATGWILSSGPGYAPWLRSLYPEAKPTRLSASALETLAIISYRQPITRADMEAVRGVSVDGVMQTLLDRGLVRIAGRSESAGRPLLYATTQYFLDHFGLRHLDELPNADELRRIPLPKAEQSGSGEAGKNAGDEGNHGLPDGEGESSGQSPGAQATETGEIPVDSILELRESVVFEEITAQAEPASQEAAPASEG